MKSLFLAVFAVIAFSATGAAAAGCGQMVCHDNPVCQVARNSGNCEAARAAGGTSGGSSSRQKCPARQAWSSYNQECSHHNWCWQKLGIPSSGPTGTELAKLEACKAKG